MSTAPVVVSDVMVSRGHPIPMSDGGVVGHGVMGAPVGEVVGATVDQWSGEPGLAEAVSGGDTRCPRFFGGIQSLLWFTRGMNTPPLITASDDPNMTRQYAGVIDHPSTQTVMGGRLDNNFHSGFRVFAGVNLDCCGCNRLQWNYFNLDTDSFFVEYSSPDDFPVLARPFYNDLAGENDAEMVGYPGLVEGSITVDGSTDFQGYGFDWMHNLLCHFRKGCGSGRCGQPSWRLRSFDAVLGWRHYDLDESLTIRERLTATDPAGAVPLGTTLDIVDRFRTTNEFDGFNFGLVARMSRCSRYGFTARALAAVGRNRQSATISGSTSIVEPNGGTVLYDAGLLALGSNSGTFEQDRTIIVPEFGFDFHYNLFGCMRLTAGYTLVYWNNVLRPGGIIDDTIDPRLLPPESVPNSGRPEYVARQDDFWAQGLNLGVEFQF